MNDYNVTLFALKFTEARNMEWSDKVFLAKYDTQTNNVGLLVPFDADKFSFEDELQEIEQDLLLALHDALGKQSVCV